MTDQMHPSYPNPSAVEDHSNHRELGTMKLKNAMYSAQEDDGSFDYTADKYNTMRASQTTKVYRDDR